ncbi:T9SS type B sorting domain-containing protein [Lewinella sp. JB7]|uniref:T9SS type B sorting domain-containing protein n=1 Tax=Lewinella sp. JB7 TaxID=2962887 RepID=UPI0020C9BBA0|nr:T9SS type B sorting domain-containing protein [Lewinella sp. JB7]MCP9235787.1 gliding motility-associated C-terminal domain-containing protein [Lewinella sp. JB7]
MPNPSLEHFNGDQSGCTSVQPGGLPDAVNQANCLTGWQRVSLGTTDSWNAFTLPGAGPYFPAQLPLPLPSGTGVSGFWVGIKDAPNRNFVNGNGSTTEQYREYLAACLVDGQRMQTGQAYRLTFSLGFMEPQVAVEDSSSIDIQSPGPIELSIYGVRECGQLNFGEFYSCPEEAGAAGYELITNITLDGSPGSWTAAQADFIARGSYAGFAIGGSCAPDHERPNGGLYRNYYFIDNLILNTPDAFTQPVAGPVQVDGLTVCDEQITLTGKATPGATYQWYRNGIAMVGQTGRVLTLRGGPSVDGRYALRVSTPLGCAVTDEVNVQRPVISDLFADTVAICNPGDTVVVYPRRTSGASFRWSDGSTGGSLAVSEPGTYSVTITEACIEHTESFTAAIDPPFTYEITTTPANPCPGDTVTVRVSSNSYAPSVYFRSLPDERMLRADRGSVQVIAGETDALLAFVGNKCGLSMDTVYLSTADIFTVRDVAINHLVCGEGSGRISVTVADDDAVSYEWTDAAGQPIGDDAPVLEVTEAGTYTLTLMDGVRCPRTYTYTVENETTFAATFSVDQGGCGIGGGITTTKLTGQSPYSFRWFRDGAPLAGTDDRRALTKLYEGDYRVRITDATGCTITYDFALRGSPPLRASAASTPLACGMPYSGSITVSAEGGVPPYTYRLNATREQTFPAFEGLPAGTYRIAVIDSRGCAFPLEPIVFREPTPTAIELVNSRAIHLGDTVVLNVGTREAPGASGTFEWTPARGLSCTDCAAPAAAPAVTTEYTVTYTNADNCSTSERIVVNVNQLPRIYAPTAFSPNGDDVNDVFRVHRGGSVVSVTDLRIFDRWGELIWVQDSEEDPGWDGTFRGKPLSGAVFAYVGTVLLRNGMTVPFKGSVTLIN